ncbi:hypothetical protein ACLOJK_021704 [Asimina triloba]
MVSVRVRSFLIRVGRCGGEELAIRVPPQKQPKVQSRLPLYGSPTAPGPSSVNRYLIQRPRFNFAIHLSDLSVKAQTPSDIAIRTDSSAKFLDGISHELLSDEKFTQNFLSFPCYLR